MATVDDVRAEIARRKALKEAARAELARRRAGVPPIPRPSMGAALPKPPTGEGLLVGAEDPLYGTMQLTRNLLGRSIDDDINLRERVYQKGRGEDAGFDWSRLGGNVGMLAPLGLVGSPSLLFSAGLGGVTSASQPVVGSDDFWTEKAKQTGLGLATGAAGHLGTQALAAGIKPVKGAATKLFDEGVRPTVGAIVGGPAKRIEDALTSVPILGDVIKSAQGGTIREFNRAVYNRALNPIGEKFKGDIGREGVASVRMTLNKAYQDLLPKLQLKPDQQLVDDLSNVVRGAADDFLDEASNKRLGDLLNRKLIQKLSKGPMSGETLKRAEHDLARMAKKLQADNDTDKRLIGEALDDSLTAVREALQRSNPAHAGRLRDLNRGWANYTRLRSAASATGAEDGVFTPAQLAQAVRSQDKSVGKGQYSEGRALMQDLSDAGKSALAQRIPDSGTPYRAFAGGAGLGLLDPMTMAATGVGAAPYAPGMRQFMANAMLRRPEFLEPVANAVRSIQPYPAIGAAAASGELSR